MLRIGIDVGGTHTDAVLLDGDEVVASTKALTSVVSLAISTGTAVSSSGRIGCAERILNAAARFAEAIDRRRALD